MIKERTKKSDKKRALRFQHVYLENWRNFVEVDVPLQRRVFLAGPNASGKSNFLDVFRFLHDIASPIGGGFQNSVQKRQGVSSLRALAARRYSDIIIRTVIGSESESKIWEYELHFSQDNLRRAVIKKEILKKKGKVIFERPDGDDQEDPERLTQTFIEQVNMNREFRELVDFMGSIRYLHIVPQLVREPDRSVGRKQDPYGGDFLELIARTPDKTQNAWLKRIQQALSIAVPQLESIELKRDARGTPHLRGKYTHWRPQGAWQMEEQFSDGTLRLLGLLWAVIEGSGPLLLEEPELSLHPEVVHYLPQIFARVERRTGRQFFISTHSRDLLQDKGIGLDEVLILLPTEEGSRLKVVKEMGEAKRLLSLGAVDLADFAISKTRPEKSEQLSFFGDFDNGKK